MSKHERPTSRSLRTSAGVAALALGLVAVSAGAAFSQDRAAAPTVPLAAGAPAADTLAADRTMADLSAGRLPVPPELVPPAGNVLSATLAAKGVQVYRCVKTESTPPGNPTLGWTFVEPVATLAGRTGQPRPATAVHFRGPSWQSDQDGSLVEGRAKASSPVPGSIPQLLVQAVRNQGTGIFGRVTFIQRLATGGGAAPSGACTEGTVTGVPYRAVYRFFVPAA